MSIKFLVREASIGSSAIGDKVAGQQPRATPLPRPQTQLQHRSRRAAHADGIPMHHPGQRFGAFNQPGPSTQQEYILTHVHSTSLHSREGPPPRQRGCSAQVFKSLHAVAVHQASDDEHIRRKSHHLSPGKHPLGVARLHAPRLPSCQHHHVWRPKPSSDQRLQRAQDQASRARGRGGGSSSTRRLSRHSPQAIAQAINRTHCFIAHSRCLSNSQHGGENITEG